MLIFQFTLPREERRQVQAQPLTLQNFNPRSHERSDHITQSFVFRFFNFNPRSHERSDYDIRRDRHGGYISIHAPTRGATLMNGCMMKNIWISIHAPTRGATKVACYLATLIKFQSTLPREERQYPKSNICSYQKISIHAPTRGATVYESSYCGTSL